MKFTSKVLILLFLCLGHIECESHEYVENVLVKSPSGHSNGGTSPSALQSGHTNPGPPPSNPTYVYLPQGNQQPVNPTIIVLPQGQIPLNPMQANQQPVSTGYPQGPQPLSTNYGYSQGQAVNPIDRRSPQVHPSVLPTSGYTYGHQNTNPMVTYKSRGPSYGISPLVHQIAIKNLNGYQGVESQGSTQDGEKNYLNDHHYVAYNYRRQYSPRGHDWFAFDDDELLLQYENNHEGTDEEAKHAQPQEGAGDAGAEGETGEEAASESDAEGGDPSDDAPSDQPDEDAPPVEDPERR
ncbi:uncharacterized protein LOC113372229 isoform X2 [Ctenocephalides felis]|uniref:uncharacterized protein LOC113372229 isoform X2 n=1 Tax=Ctenocephalides felis TaxID=7515 RepID=UPI000E6E1FCE|nr:uncharacterized protein LOC113372229 isoform X2 [Ctenocephalides felis]